MTGDGTRTGGEILVDQMLLHGTDAAFCVPGESYLPVLDALYGASDTVRLVTCRHESAAANMAEAYGKLTGRPGVALVTRGPGAFHASIGVHTAAQDSTPMILLVGQVDTTDRGREGFQEVDYEKVFGSVAKWVVEVQSAKRLPELVGRAYATAVSGRPGPVVLALPHDMLASRVDVADGRPYREFVPAPTEPDATGTYALFGEAERPILIVGGSTWNQDGCASLQRFAERHDIPVVSSFRRQYLLDNASPVYAGTLGNGVNKALAARIASADLVVALGARLGELTTVGYTLLDVPRPRQRLVHVHPGADELGRVYQPDLAVNGDVNRFAAALDRQAGLDDGRLASWRESARNDYLDFTKVPTSTSTNDSYVDLAAVIDHLDDALPDNAVIANGAGNYTIWVQRYFRFGAGRRQLAPTSGAMGYGLPAGLAAKVVTPEREVIVLGGDGCLMMTVNELATAVQYGLDVLVIVADNGSLGTIRMHQERHYPGRVVGTELRNPSFADLACTFGAYGERVTSTKDFPAALQRARAAQGPALLELTTDARQLTPEHRRA